MMAAYRNINQWMGSTAQALKKKTKPATLWLILPVTSTANDDVGNSRAGFLEMTPVAMMQRTLQRCIW
jgi:hypothetical protein